MRIAIGSKNPAKVRAVRIALKKIFPKTKIKVIEVDAPSKVSAQPKTDRESIKGAINRARFAQEETDADFGIGIEGGLSHVGTYKFSCSLTAVVSKEGILGLGSSARFELPKKVLKMLDSGLELGEIMDKLTGKVDTKKSSGAMGIFTNGILPRDLAYSHGLIFAFAPFISKKYWE